MYLLAFSRELLKLFKTITTYNILCRYAQQSVITMKRLTAYQFLANIVNRVFALAIYFLLELSLTDTLGYLAAPFSILLAGGQRVTDDLVASLAPVLGQSADFVRGRTGI